MISESIIFQLKSFHISVEQFHIINKLLEETSPMHGSTLIDFCNIDDVYTGKSLHICQKIIRLEYVAIFGRNQDRTATIKSRVMKCNKSYAVATISEIFTPSARTN